MDHQAPPPVFKPISPQKRAVRTLMALIFAFLLVLGGIFVLWLLFMLWWAKELGQVSVTSYMDKFSITVLETKSQPNFFEEKVRIQCERDMTAGIWVTDLKKEGLFETRGPEGQIFYEEGHPHRAGSSAPVKAEGQYSTCEILFRVNTTSTNTVWHDECAGGTVDTAFSSPLQVTDVQTNWLESYNRGSEIPLANLGDYKILVSVQ
jgi:hypothetical protein